MYLQQIAEQKLKAFSIGTMGKRPLSKKELEEQRKKEQEQAAAQVNNTHSAITVCQLIHVHNYFLNVTCCRRLKNL